MDAGQILQVVLSLGVVALALYLSARLARRRLGPGGDEALRVVARQAVSRTQNLVVVEANGHRHLVALTDGGAHTVETWDVPAAEAETGPRHAAARAPSRPVLSLALPTLQRPSPVPGTAARAASGRRAKTSSSTTAPAPTTGSGSFAAKLAALQAQTQWAPLGSRK